MEHRQKRTLEDSGALPREGGELVREYEGMHEENLLSSWLREDVDGKAEEMEKTSRRSRRRRRRGKLREKRKGGCG